MCQVQLTEKQFSLFRKLNCIPSLASLLPVQSEIPGLNDWKTASPKRLLGSLFFPRWEKKTNQFFIKLTMFFFNWIEYFKKYSNSNVNRHTVTTKEYPNISDIVLFCANQWTTCKFRSPFNCITPQTEVCVNWWRARGVHILRSVRSTAIFTYLHTHHCLPPMCISLPCFLVMQFLVLRNFHLMSGLFMMLSCLRKNGTSRRYIDDQ